MPRGRVYSNSGRCFFRIFFQLVLLLLLSRNIHGATKLSGFYTNALNDVASINNGYSYWFPCGGLYLTFKSGTNKLLLAPQGPTSPPANQVWRVDPVAGAEGQYTIRAAFQKPLGPTYLAYSLNCSKNEPFLAKEPSAAGIGVRWTMSNANQMFATVGRTCGIRYQIARFGAGTNASCAVPATAAKQRSLKLIRSVAEPQGGWITWRQDSFVPYPKKLQADVTAVPGWETLRGHNLLGGFGATLAISGETIVAGQAQAAYVFTKSTSGGWTRRTLPPPPKGKNEAVDFNWHSWPYQVSVSRDLAVVGVPWYPIKRSKLRQPGQVLLYQLADLGARPTQVRHPHGAVTEFGLGVHVSDAFLATTDGKKIFIWALTPGNPKKLASKAPQTTLALRVPPPNGVSGFFVLWGSTLAIDSGNNTLIYEYNISTKKWAQRARLDTGGAVYRHLALHGDTLVVSRADWYQTSPDQPLIDDTYVLLSIYKRNAAGKWGLAQEIKEEVLVPKDSRRLYSGPALDGETLVIGCTIRTDMRSDYFGNHKIFIYTKSGPGGAWARADVIERKDDFSSMGMDPKAVLGDIIASGSTAFSQGGEFAGMEGAVLLFSRRRELAAS